MTTHTIPASLWTPGQHVELLTVVPTAQGDVKIASRATVVDGSAHPDRADDDLAVSFPGNAGSCLVKTSAVTGTYEA